MTARRIPSRKVGGASGACRSRSSLLCAIPLAAGAVRLVTLAAGAEVTPENARFFAAPLPVVLHIVAAAAYIVLGAFQFVPGFRRRRPGWHRRVGRLLVGAGLVAALSGLWMAQFYRLPAHDGALLYGFRLLFGSLMALSIVLGVAAIRRRELARHRAWMMRGYALGLGAGTQVLTLGVGEIVLGPPGEVARGLLMGAAWAINLAVAEWLIRRAPAPPARTASPTRATGYDQAPSAFRTVRGRDPVGGRPVTLIDTPALTVAPPGWRAPGASLVGPTRDEQTQPERSHFVKTLQASIDIDAPAERVWAILTDIAAYRRGTRSYPALPAAPRRHPRARRHHHPRWPVVDQAALHGLLQRVRDLECPVPEVRRAKRAMLSMISSADLDPDERLRIGIVVGQVQADGILQCTRAAVAATPKLLFGQGGEPALDLVDPGRVGRREVQVEAWVSEQASDGSAASCACRSCPG